MNKENKPPKLVKDYSEITTHNLSSKRWLGCFNSKGEYKEVCVSSNKLWFRCKVFFFKIIHPHWKFSKNA